MLEEILFQCRNHKSEITNSTRPPLRGKTRSEEEYIWALKDINLEVEQGEVLGIIGKNGAGKSTLLKILSKVTAPSTGIIKAKGRIASLLEVGTGFHSEMTGRENIFMNGAILGMSKPEIRKKFDEIVDFAGVEQFIDTPVKRYSSGMLVRLGFAVAAHLEPDILIVDEVLAVGDAEFQRKAIGKMDDISKVQGKTVLFVSHNMEAIKNICPIAILLQKGQIISKGNVEDILYKYLKGDSQNEFLENFNVYNTENVEISRAYIKNKNKIIKNGDDFEFIFNIEFKKELNYSIIINFYRNNIKAFGASTFYRKESIIGPGKFIVSTHIPKYLLNPGIHSIHLAIVDGTGNFHEYIYVEDILYFHIYDDNFRRGGLYNNGWDGAVCPILEFNIDKFN